MVDEVRRSECAYCDAHVHVRHWGMLQSRLVVLMEPDEMERLRELADRRGESVAAVVRRAIRTLLYAETFREDARSDAAEFLCREHDPEFDWAEVKRDLVDRDGG